MSNIETEMKLSEERDKRVAAEQERFKRLHVCGKLSGNATFYACGNGLGKSFRDNLVLWFSEPRKEGGPGRRTKKSEVSSYLQQDAVDALIGFANIGEKVAPFAFDAGFRPEAPESAWVGSSEEGMKALIREAGLFIDRFGLPHMCSEGDGPGTRKRPFRLYRLRFSEAYADEHSEELKALLKSLADPEMKQRKDFYLRELKNKGLYDEGDVRETERRILFDGLFPIAKDFKFERGFDRERETLEAEEKRLDELRRQAVMRYSAAEVDSEEYVEGVVDERNRANEMHQLHLGEDALTYAAFQAHHDFDETERGYLTRDGYALPSLERMYRIGLLFRDALELHLAISGDELAFRRILGKVHMEKYEASLPWWAEEDGNSRNAIYIAENRYTIWFESSGMDYDNPGSDMDPHEYRAEVDGVLLELRRQRVDNRSDGERYGCGRAVHALCKPNETPKQFEEVARHYLGVFLDGLIKEGVDQNYKHLFAGPSPIDPKDPKIKVNDFDSDLVRTLWTVMDAVNKGDIAVNIARCKCCGRLMNTAKEAGHPREYCDSSCRSLHRKRMKSQEKTGREHPGIELRRRFFEFEESQEAVHIGMLSNMGPEMQPEEPVKRQSMYECILEKMFGMR